MTTPHEVAGERERFPATGTDADCRPLTLREEHGLLLRQVAVRAEDVLRVLAADRWPTEELRALLSYLHAEVLTQVADEERLLFPTHASSAAVDQLRLDHTNLRLMIEFLTSAAVDQGRHAPAELAATTRDLVTHLERHLSVEEGILVTGTRAEAEGTTSRTGQRHEWFSLAEGETIDLDTLPASRVVDVVVDRLLRLRSGEEVQLHCSSDPYAVWQRMDRLRPGDYGFAYLQDGPHRWRIQVIRREPAE